MYFCRVKFFKQIIILTQKKMKKLFAILAVVAFVFAACGPKAETTENCDSTAVEETVVEEVVADTTACDSAAVAECVAE